MFSPFSSFGALFNIFCCANVCGCLWEKGNWVTEKDEEVQNSKNCLYVCGCRVEQKKKRRFLRFLWSFLLERPFFVFQFEKHLQTCDKNALAHSMCCLPATKNRTSNGFGVLSLKTLIVLNYLFCSYCSCCRWWLLECVCVSLFGAMNFRSVFCRLNFFPASLVWDCVRLCFVVEFLWNEKRHSKYGHTTIYARANKTE